MTLFELEALLELDTSDFENGVTGSIDKAKQMQAAFDNLNIPNIDTGNLTDIDTEIEALDQEIKELEEEIADLELDLQIDYLDEQNSAVEKEIDRSEKRTSAFAGVVEGVADAAADFVSDLIGEAFEFVDASFEKAANSGSELSKRYQEDMAGLNTTVSVVQDTIGNALLSMTVDSLNLYKTLDDVLSGLFDITPQDKVNAALKQISEYNFDNLEKARKDISEIFVIGEKAETELEDGAKMSYEDLVASYESQIEYWNNYETMMSDLLARGVSQEMLYSNLANDETDYTVLSWLHGLTDEQLAHINDLYGQVAEREEAAAQTYNRLELSNDPEYQGMLENAANLEAELQQWEETGNGRIPYKSILKETGDYVDSETGGGKRFGIPDYAEEQEAVSSSIDAMRTVVEGLPTAITGALTGASVLLDGNVVGELIFPTISSKLRRQSTAGAKVFSIAMK